jgi:ribosome-associated protein
LLVAGKVSYKDSIIKGMKLPLHDNQQLITSNQHMIDISKEISFQTTRSGGKGGQNVNKVETAVIGFFQIETSSFFTEEQKQMLKEKLSNRINADGFLMVKSQTHRTQLSNKQEVVKKMNELVTMALQKKKPRIATKTSKASKERRLESKKRKAEIKSGRQKLKPGNF